MGVMTQEEYIAILFADCGYDTSAHCDGAALVRGCQFIRVELSESCVEPSATLKEEKTGCATLGTD